MRCSTASMPISVTVHRHMAEPMGWPLAMSSNRPSGTPIQVRHNRSEEHTSELQSLMRISYAVFCLKKKKMKKLKIPKHNKKNKIRERICAFKIEKAQTN